MGKSKAKKWFDDEDQDELVEQIIHKQEYERLRRAKKQVRDIKHQIESDYE